MAITLKSQSQLAWIFLASILGFTAVFLCQLHAQSIPAGWVLYPTPKEGSLSIQCASASVRPQSVSLPDRGQLEIQQLPASYGRDEYSKQQLPESVTRQQGMAGRQSILKISGGGWLLGFDAGEFGGGLWSADRSGNMRELSRENVHGLVDTPQGVLVFVGLAHMGLDSGSVLIVPYTAKSKADVKTLVKLDGAPEALTRISSDTVLLVTTRGITEISSFGGTKTLLHRDFRPLHPNSVVSMPDGTVYVGMHLFLLRFAPRAEHNAEQWFLPKSCEGFETTGCICTGR
jgi:hypothetical protein